MLDIGGAQITLLDLLLYIHPPNWILLPFHFLAVVRHLPISLGTTETNEKGTFLSNWKSPQKLLSGFLFCRNRPQCNSLILITVQKINLFPKRCLYVLYYKSTKVSLLRQIAADPWTGEKQLTTMTMVII